MSEFPSFLRLNNILKCVMYHILLIRSSIHVHLGYFRILTILNNAVINMGIQVSLPDPAFNYNMNYFLPAAKTQCLYLWIKCGNMQSTPNSVWVYSKNLTSGSDLFPEMRALIILCVFERSYLSILLLL